MRTELELNQHFSVGSTIMKLALVGGLLVSSMYGILVIFASALKALA